MNRADKRQQAKQAAKKGVPPAPDAPAGLLRQGVQLPQQGRLAEAAACYQRILALAPGQMQANHLMGLIEHQRGDNDAAEAHIGKALMAAPDNPDYLCDMGVVLNALARPLEAAEKLRAALRRRPGDVRILNNLATAQLQMGRQEEAAASYRAALEREPRNAAMHNNLGNVLTVIGETEAAIASYLEALAIDPAYVDAHSNLGYALMGLGQLDEAIRHFDAALQLKPETIGARFNLGLALAKQGHTSDAVESFRAALRINPKFVEAVRGLGDMLIKLGRTEEAIAQYELALEYQPDYAAALGGLLFFQNYLADIDPATMLEKARRFGAMVTDPAAVVKHHDNNRDPNRRLRVGLVSGDFCTHVVARFLETVLPEIDLAQIELFAYATADKVDAMTSRLQESIPNWRRVTYFSDARLTQTILADQIDILVDLSGQSAGNRLATFARKPAPVAVTWLGYFATTGIEAIDYVLANRWVIPEGEERQWVEKPWRLPDTYLCFSPPKYDVPIGPLPARSNGYVTFGSCNNLNKLSDRTVECWAGVLKAVPGSRLLLRTEALADVGMARQTRERFLAHGIAAERLKLEGALADYAAHLRQYNRIDIALDPFPYTGGTTSVEALWMGAPVLTRKGDRYVAHMGESILHNMAMPEWIAADTEDYVLKAAAFAADLDGLDVLKRSLRPRFVASPLCDAPRFARQLEAAFRGMWQIWCAGQSALPAGDRLA